MAQLLGISSDPIGVHLPDIVELQNQFRRWGRLGLELAEILSTCNGFWAYESSLLLRPFRSSQLPLGIIEWNDQGLWKSAYNDPLDMILFFGEDAFGCQFCLVGADVCTFDPETAHCDKIATTFGEWARVVMEDCDFRTGYSLAHAWQAENVALKAGERLLPRVPFVLGGKYELGNLYVGSDVEGMVFRASIANQIASVPDGGQVVVQVEDRNP